VKAIRLLPLLCALAVVAGGCGGIRGDSVAEVDGAAIQKDAFDHWMRIAAKEGDATEAQRRDQVLQLLISREWIKGEAEEQGVKVSDAEVRQTYDQQKEQSFPQDEDFRKFLSDSGQTEQDLLLQVRLGLLSNAITEKVVEGEGDQQQALDRFAADFRRRWRERTDCRRPYLSSVCKNGPDPTPTPTPEPVQPG
jgi:foldase protein PrsA